MIQTQIKSIDFKIKFGNSISRHLYREDKKKPFCGVTTGKRGWEYITGDQSHGPICGTCKRWFKHFNGFDFKEIT